MRTYTKEYVAEKLRTSEPWIYRALVVLYEAQTRTEQGVWRTIHKNDVGFNKPDAKLLMEYGRIVSKGGKLNMYELPEAKKRLPKYAGQILRLIEQKQQLQAA